MLNHIGFSLPKIRFTEMQIKQQHPELRPASLPATLLHGEGWLMREALWHRPSLPKHPLQRPRFGSFFSNSSDLKGAFGGGPMWSRIHKGNASRFIKALGG